MTALQTNMNQTAMTGTVVPLQPDPQPPAQALPNSTSLTRLLHWSESWHDEQGIHMPDIPADLVEALPAAIDQARQDLEPGDPGEVMAALSTLASRRGFRLPEGMALELDVEVLSSWPRDLWRKGFRGVWEGFAYRRMPEPADFRAHIAADFEERRARLARLKSLQLRLETIRLRQQWDEESRRRRPQPCP
jgi:hypothetical protein